MAPIFLLDYCPYDHEEAETLRGKGAAWPRPRVSSQQGGGGNRPRRAWAREAAAAQPRASARTRGKAGAVSVPLISAPGSAPFALLTATLCEWRSGRRNADQLAAVVLTAPVPCGEHR